MTNGRVASPREERAAPLGEARPKRFRIALVVTVLAVLVWSGIAPYRLGTWFFETVWVFLGLAAVLFTWRRFPLTTLLCTVLALWAIVLAYGGHTTYAHTPFGDWLQTTFDLDRNPYDRIGHFMQGFVPAIAVREILWRTSPLGPSESTRSGPSRWLGPLTICVCLAISAFWELMEWWGAYLVAGGDPGFLGHQGDPWDTQWDMALALLGAILALVLLRRLHDRQLRTVARISSAGNSLPA